MTTKPASPNMTDDDFQAMADRIEPRKLVMRMILLGGEYLDKLHVSRTNPLCAVVVQLPDLFTVNIDTPDRTASSLRSFKKLSDVADAIVKLERARLLAHGSGIVVAIPRDGHFTGVVMGGPGDDLNKTITDADAEIILKLAENPVSSGGDA